LVAARAADHLGDLGCRAGDDAPAAGIERLDVRRADRVDQLALERHRGPRGTRRVSPILPGFKMPSGSSACLAASKIAIASRCSAAMNGALSSPTPWWWLIVPPTCVVASSPSRQIASYSRSAAVASGAVPTNVK